MNNPRCPQCGSTVWKYGIRENKRGSFQRYRCRNRYCGAQFIDDDFLGMQTPKEAVAHALRLRAKGLPRAEAMDELEKENHVKRHPNSLQYWEKKFAEAFRELNRKGFEAVSSRMHFDHTQIKINGQKGYCFALKDACLKILVGWYIALSKETCNAKEALRDANRKMPVKFDLEEIVIDGESTLRRAINEVFHHRVAPYRYKGFVDRKNNNLVENLFKFKERIPRFRSLERARDFIEIWAYVYNAKRLGLDTSLRDVISFLAKFREMFMPKIFIRVL